MKTIQEHREAHTLTVKMRYDEGIMTRKEWIDLKHSQGYFTKEGTKAKVQYSRSKYNRLTGKEQEIYEKKCEERIVSYELRHPQESAFYDITKAEFNYFNSLGPMPMPTQTEQLTIF